MACGAAAKEHLPELVPAFTKGVAAHLEANGGTDVLHANYWLSGVAGHHLKHQLDLPLVCTFHTLARVKAESGDPEPERRERAEADIIGCADAVLASCTEEAAQFERLYGPVARAPRDRGARASSTPSSRPVTAGGRGTPSGWATTPCSCSSVASSRSRASTWPCGRWPSCPQRDAVLVVVGGASGADGDAEVRRVHALADELGVAGRVRFVPPQPHHLLSSWYRAADVSIVPSRSESFGLVALEAAACGTPVVASAVGGLRTLVDDGHTGYLIDGRDPADFAAAVGTILGDPRLAEEMSVSARRPGPPVHVVHRGGPPAPALRRRGRDGPRPVPMTSTCGRGPA